MPLPTASGNLKTANGTLANVSGRGGGGGGAVEVIEDWESGDFTTNNWTGDLASYTVASGAAAIDGTNYLEGQGDYIASGDVPNAPERGDYFKLLLSGSASGDRNRIFWGPDVQGYNAGQSYMVWHDSSAFLRLYDAGAGDLLGSISVNGSNITDGEWWEIHVDYGYTTNDDIEVFLYGTDQTLIGSVGPITNTAYGGEATAEFGIRHQVQSDVAHPQRSDYYHIDNNDQGTIQ